MRFHSVPIENGKQYTAFYLVPCFVGLHLNPEYEGSTDIRNACKLLQNNSPEDGILYNLSNN
jgi:hypothetical protein